MTGVEESTSHTSKLNTIFIRNVNNDGQALLTVMADTAWQKRSSGVQHNSPSGKYNIS